MMNRFDEELVEILNEEFQGKPVVNEGRYCDYYLVDRFITPVEFLCVEIKDSETGYTIVNSVATIQFNAETMHICSNAEFNEVLTSISNQILAYRI